QFRNGSRRSRPETADRFKRERNHLFVTLANNVQPITQWPAAVSEIVGNTNVPVIPAFVKGGSYSNRPSCGEASVGGMATKKTTSNSSVPGEIRHRFI